MDSKLEQMRHLLREEEEKKTGNRPTTGGDKAVYPYWNIPEKMTATVRFLPDKDEDNPWFWAERQTIRLPFNGVVGGDRPSSGPVVVTVPCVDMFGDVCPIIAETRPLWKSNEELARKYWKKRSYIAQGFVLSSPFSESEPPENPIRRMFLGFSLLEKLKAGLRDPEMENVPTDYLNGTDFKIKKTRKGDYNNYDTSEWSRRSRPLSEAEQIAIEQHGLWNLSDFKGQRPDAEHIAVIAAMFHASMKNQPYDMASFGTYYKPFGVGTEVVSAPEGVDDFTSTPMSATPAIHPVSAATLAESDDAKSGGPMDLMKALRERNARV